jgi:hypothetical protein
MYLKGLYLYFQGGNGKLYVGYNDKDQMLDTGVVKSCNLESRKSVFFYIHGDGPEITVATHSEAEGKFTRCAEFEINPLDMEQFYVNFFARSFNTSGFMIDIKSLIFSTRIENIAISEFQSKIDEGSKNLFRQISFYSLNEQLLKEKKKAAGNDDYNIKSLFESQTEVLDNIDYSNILLDKNLEDGDEMIEFLSRQKNSTEIYARSVIDMMNLWMEDTSKQFEIMEKDALDLLTEYEKFDLDGEFQKTKTLISQINQKMGDNSQAFQTFRAYSSQIKENLTFLVNKKKHLVNFPDLIDHYIAGRFGSADLTLDKPILIMFVGLGLVVAFALCAILKRIGGPEKVRTLD